MNLYIFRPKKRTNRWYIIQAPNKDLAWREFIPAARDIGPRQRYSGSLPDINWDSTDEQVKDYFMMVQEVWPGHKYEFPAKAHFYVLNPLPKRSLRKRA